VRKCGYTVLGNNFFVHFVYWMTLTKSVKEYGFFMEISNGELDLHNNKYITFLQFLKSGGNIT